MCLLFGVLADRGMTPVVRSAEASDSPTEHYAQRRDTQFPIHLNYFFTDSLVRKYATKFLISASDNGSSRPVGIIDTGLTSRD